MLQWFDVAGGRADEATLTVRTKRGRKVKAVRLGDDRMKHVAIWQLEPSSGRTLVLEVSPLDTLAAIDLY